jgi:anti-sigma factor RsiW
MPKMEKDEPSNGRQLEKLTMSQLLRDERLADMLSSYLDKGLRGRELTEFEALLLENPAIAREVEDMRRVEEALKLMGEDVLHEPIPPMLLEALRGGFKE